MSEEHVYQSPKADLDTDHEVIKRPVFVWIIFIFMCLGVLGLGFSYAMIMGYIPVDDSMRAYYDSMSVFDHIMMVAGYLYGFYAALQLFRLKVMAFYLYLAAIPIQVVSVMYNMTNSHFITLLESQGSNIFASLVPGVAFSLLLFGYVYYLKNRGILAR